MISSTSMTCPHCQKTIVEDSLFCAYCGEKVRNIELPISKTVELTLFDRSSDASTNNSNSDENKKSIKNKLLSIEDLIKRKGNYLEPKSENDAKDRIAAAIASRRGQAKFRSDLFGEYKDNCLITGPTTPVILEAAHIRPYKDDGLFHISNGLLLRADIHTLFDLGLIAINTKTCKVEIHKSLTSTSYRELVKNDLLIKWAIIDKTALDEHYTNSKVNIQID